MSRRDNKRQAYGGMIVPRKQSEDSAPKGPGQKVCGTCKNYSESSWASDGRGSCNYLKLGSNITSAPPVYELEGKEGYLTMTLSDASNCKYYEKMKLIDKDGYECSDPQYRRTIRQLQDK
ncbi:MAG: hypothetical protein R6X10_00190 [Desulfobacterales bacterium]